MRRKRAEILLLAGVLAASLSFPAFAGWEVKMDGYYSYTLENGETLKDGFSEDGYYVDSSGYWKSSNVIFFTEIPARNYFVKASANQGWAGSKSVIDGLKTVVSMGMAPIRNLKVGDDLIEYVRLSDKEETLLFSLTTDKENDGYVLKLATSLSKDSTGTVTMAWYDYQVLRVLMASFSRTGDKISDAVYSSWEAKNSYGLSMQDWVLVGDSEIRYTAGNGVGYYSIRPAAVTTRK